MAKRKATAAADAGEQQHGKQQRKAGQQQRKQLQPAVVEDPAPPPVVAASNGGWKNKEKVLVVGSRGITYRCVSEAPDAAPWRLRVLPAAHACRRCRLTAVAAC